MSSLRLPDTSIDLNSAITDMDATLEAMETGALIGLWFQSLVLGLTMNALSICIMLVVLSLNLLGDGLRDALDPKLKK